MKIAHAGDILALAGLKDTTTGDTLSDPANQVVLERMQFPDPVISVAVEPKSKADQEKMGVALGRLAAEDPSFRVRTDHDSGQTVISGMGELHLDIIVDRMMREFKVEVMSGGPRLRIAKPWPRARISITPTRSRPADPVNSPGQDQVRSRGTGRRLYLQSKVVGGNVPKEYIPGVEKGLRSEMESGSCRLSGNRPEGDALRWRLP